MKLIDGLTLKGTPANIPDCNREDLPGFFKEMGYKVGVEIGVYKGWYTRKFCEAGLKMFGVDPWMVSKEYHEKQGQGRQDFLYDHASRYMADYDCELIRKTSMDAVKDFEDESIDFVYIDGHHGFKYVTEDIYEWSKKVKKGGIVSGHDYALSTHSFDFNNPFVLQVPYVLPAYTEAFRINTWFVLGSGRKIKGEKRDTFRSWMWIKT